MREGITVSYSGVHQAFQLALAAEECDQLNRFLTSMFDGPGKWGRRLSGLLGEEMLQNRRLPGIPAAKVVEHPWPELIFKLRQRFLPTAANAWIQAAQAFDYWAARQLTTLSSRVIVCAENCAFQTFKVATELGWKRVYDCPGHNAKLWNEAAQETAHRFALPFVSMADTPEITRRKETEISCADAVLTYSKFHAEGVVARGVTPEKIVTIPLWTDPAFWTPASEADGSNRDEPLRVIFAGGINLRKGIPFLIEAIRKLTPKARLTLVGSLNEDVKPCLAGMQDWITVMPPVSKIQLRSLYQSHDVLVLPSLGDSFGFVAMEAMACGLPVVVTTNCGVPIPDESWRVPVMDSAAIAQRLERYAEEKDLLDGDGRQARKFALEFTPKRYRQQVAKFYRQLLN